MPTVPRRSTGYVSTIPHQQISPAGAFTPPQPVDYGPAAKQVAALVEEHARQADQVALLAADNQLSDTATTLETQTLSRKGMDALNAGPEVEEQWKKSTDNISNSLTNDRQKRAFQERADHHWQALNETVQKHGQAEFQKYDADNTDSALSNRLDTAVKHYSDPLIVGQSLAESKDLVELYGHRQGWSPEQVQQHQTDTASKIHTGVIQTMLTAGNDLTATKYFSDHKAELNATDTMQVQRALDVGSRRGESQRQADRIMQSTTSMTDAVAEARKIEDPEVRDLTESRVRSDYVEKAAEMRDAREQMMSGATNIIEKTHSFDAIPPGQVALMTVDERKSLRSYADELNGKGPGGIKTDLPTYYNLETMATTPETRDKFLALDLNQYKGRLSASDFEEMAKLQGQVRKGEDKPLKQLYTNQQIVTGVIKQAQIGVDPKGKTTDARLTAQFRDAVRVQTDQFEAINGKPPNGDEIKTIANELAARHIVERPGWFFGMGTSNVNVPTFQLNPGETPIVSIKDVPASAKLQIKAALQQRGHPVTDALIVQWYQKHVQTLVPEP